MATLNCLKQDLQNDRISRIFIVDNTVEAAEHAAKTGLIFTEEIPKIDVDKKQDKGEVPGKEEIA